MVGTLSNDKAAFLSIRLGCTRLVQHGNNEVILGHQLVLLHKNCEPPTQVWLVFKYVEYLSKKKGLMGFCLQTVTSVENRYFLSNLARKILLRIIRNHSHWFTCPFSKSYKYGGEGQMCHFLEPSRELGQNLSYSTYWSWHSSYFLKTILNCTETAAKPQQTAISRKLLTV